MGGGGCPACNAEKQKSPFDSLPNETKEKCLAILRKIERKEKRRHRLLHTASRYSSSSSCYHDNTGAILMGAALLGHIGHDNSVSDSSYDSDSGYDADSSDCDCGCDCDG